MLTFAGLGPGAAAGEVCSKRRPMLEADMKVHGDVEFAVTSCKTSQQTSKQHSLASSAAICHKITQGDAWKES